jgi:citrate lyase subunit beta/citryl-CoA lyase
MRKAPTLNADCIILDLEDAVAPASKDQARLQACEAIGRRLFATAEVAVRINSLDTVWASEDLAMAVAVQPDAILLPKVSTAEDVQRACTILSDLNAPPGIALWAMIESPKAIVHLHEIAETAQTQSGRLSGLVMGLNDLARETYTKFVPGRAPMLGWLGAAVLAARSNGLHVLDGVFNHLEDLEGLRFECEQASNFGFDGKTVIHPTQIEIANREFSPSVMEIARARRVIEAFEDPHNEGLGAIRIDGEMFERLHLQGARRTLACADLKQFS